ncbi:hypothetical protein A9Q96_09840 [Rhodobacterales bacterium 52_120_T64]|nr:hypothetical protein A9Q96_09840 [Rhodobacterales bacterium 52_120_T64]
MQKNVNTTSFQSVKHLPEFNIAIFSFLLNFVWELMQAPFFLSLDDVSHWDGILICLKATLGDVLIALSAFWVTSYLSKNRQWIYFASGLQITVFLFVGISITVVLEIYNTQFAKNWSYSDRMPLVPPFDIGLAPLLQWLLVPMLVLWFVRRQSMGPS